MINPSNRLPIYRKDYNNIKIKYSTLIKKKIMYANASK